MKTNFITLLISFFYVFTLFAQNSNYAVNHKKNTSFVETKKIIDSDDSTFPLNKGLLFKDDLEGGNLDNFIVINEGDPNTFSFSATAGHNQPSCILLSYSQQAHDDWLILPKVNIVQGTIFSFWYKHADDVYPEQFDVLLSTTTNDPAAFTQVLSSNVLPSTNYQKYEYDLSAYAGSEVYVCLHSTTQAMWRLYLDEFEISSTETHDLALSSFDNFPGIVAPGVILSPMVTVANLGSTQETNYSVTLEGNRIGQSVPFYNETVEITSPIPAHTGTKQINFPNWTTEKGQYVFKATVNLNGDGDVSNNTLMADTLLCKDAYMMYSYMVYDPLYKLPIGASKFDITNPKKLYNIASIDNEIPIFAGDCVNGVWYGVSVESESNTYKLCTIDFKTGDRTNLATIPRSFMCMAYDYSVELMFASRFDALYTIDLADGTNNHVGTFKDNGSNIVMYAMACNLAGELYGIAENGYLYAIDKNTASLTKLGNTGISNIKYVQSATFDHNSGILYWAQFANENSERGVLYTVNTNTAVVTKYSDIENNVELTALTFNYTNQKYMLTFSVKYANNPVEGAVVNIVGTNIVTDMNGEASIQLCNGVYEYKVVNNNLNVEGTVTIQDADVVQDISFDNTIDFELNKEMINIYPNPSEGVIYISSLKNSCQMNIFDITGKLLRTCKIQSNTTLKMEKGVYLFSFTNDKTESIVKKIVVY